MAAPFHLPIAQSRTSSPFAQMLRPLVLGASIGHPSGTLGSVGPFVRLADGRPGFVAGSYVLAPPGSAMKDWIHQPGLHDAVPLTGATRVGRLVAVAPPLAEGRSLAASAAVALDVETEGNRIPLFASAPEAGRTISGMAEARIGDEVAFVGATSGYSSGRITAIHMDLPVADFHFADAIEIVADDGHFSDAGDGGALVFRRGDMAAIGLLFARAKTQQDRSVSYALPLQPSFTALGVTLLEER
jgi:hypothetical protein